MIDEPRTERAARPAAQLLPPWPATRAPALSARDLWLLLYLPLMTAIAWCVPARAWRRICGPWARLSIRLHGSRSARQRRRLAALFSLREPDDGDRLAAAVIENHHLAHLRLLRCHRPGAWRPRIDFAGREHVARAEEAGKGAILWVMPFWAAALVTKMAFAEQGFRVSHLSRPEHGFSPTLLGRRALNRIWTSVEDRYLAERLVFSTDDVVRTLDAIVRRVRANRLLSVSVGPQGRRVFAVPVAAGALCVADGVPVLAHRTGAALLPVFTVCTGEDRFTTVVEAPLTCPPGLDRDAATQALLAGYAAVLETYLARWPEQFAGFEALMMAPTERA